MIRNGKVSWAKGYGLKLAGTTDSVDTETVFSVGSVSKVGTAAATLRLVDQGKLDLDREAPARSGACRACTRNAVQIFRRGHYS